MTKQKLSEKIRHYNDEIPREILRTMSLAEMQSYLDALRKTYPDDVATEPK